jgi:hypothetical protein
MTTITDECLLRNNCAKRLDAVHCSYSKKDFANMMKNLLIVAALCVPAFVGCKKGGGGDCAGAIGSMMKGAEGVGMPDGMKDMMKKTGDLMTKACTEGKWSSEVLDCIKAAKDGGQSCMAKLTPEQQKGFATAMMSAAGDMSKDMGKDMGKPADKPMDKAPEPVGSAAPAAADGSAAPAAGSAAPAAADGSAAAPAGSAAPAAADGSAAAPK